MRAVIAICIATCERPEGLRRLLTAIAGQDLGGTAAPAVDVIVVDNCATGSGSAVCDDLRPAFPFRLRCYREGQRGIPHARNAAFARVAPATELVAFVDDDEVPEPGWLDALLTVQAEHGADVVAGPVVPRFTAEPPRWNRDGSFHRRRRYPTGHPRDTAAAGNALVRASLLAGRPGPFDERFALTGGEDDFLFRTLAAEGARIAWADDAVVHEWVPPSRTTVRWVLRRSHRTMLNLVEFRLHRQPSRTARVLRVAHAATLFLRAAALLPLGALTAPRDGGRRLVAALQFAALGTGTIAAVLGRRYQEYRHVHPV
jgi:succinoglycan biosynthesis protein ExoM